jgi:phosphatidylglycerol:prolipoprotein diacylglycerol transferase
MDPVIFSFDLFGIHFAIRWYGLLIALGVIVGGYITDREIVRRGGREGYVWDILVWVVPAGIVGARLGYVLNDIAGGRTYFLDDPIRILYITEGGLHIYGAIALGLVAGILYTRRYPFDIWLLLDSVAPAMLIGQALGRPANFINQELYGQPTDLPWGISISGENRLGPWRDLSLYPEKTTRFHPTFAYEIIWNLLSATLILWLTRRLKEKLKPGTAFYMWMILEGVGRYFIEFFRPDQPRMGDTDISFSRIAATMLAVAGTLLILVRYEKIRYPSLSPGPQEYRLKMRKKRKRKRKRW